MPQATRFLKVVGIEPYSTTLKIAPFEKLMEFKKLVKTIFNKKTNNLLQIQTLEKLRDNLLPKLMSGEVRVKL